MKIPSGATSWSPAPKALGSGIFLGDTLRHTFRPRGTDDWLLIYTKAGSGIYRGQEGEFRSQPGDCTLYRPGAFQDYQITPDSGKWDLIFAHFLPRPDWFDWLAWPEKFPGFMILRLEDKNLRHEVVQRLQDMVRLAWSSQARAEVFGQNALEEALLWCDSINPRLAASQLDPRVGKAMDFLGAHLAEPFSEVRLAGAAGLSPSRLRHIFRLQTGSSPRDFLESRRMQRAEHLLVFSRQTIAEIAEELGFENPFYFSLRFKKHAGESPRSFRQRKLSQD